MSDRWAVHHGDCREVMQAMDAESVDSIVSDPPYGLSFMGKGWDHGVPGVEFWEAALRVAKPGAHLLAFGGTRTFHRLTVAIEDAGWDIRDCLMWVYGSGFPKSHDVSKAIDKAAGAERELGPKRVSADGTVAHDGAGKRHEGYERPWRADKQAVERNTRISYPATDAARQWQGWGTALKPAWEPIILARKPLSGTVAENVLRHGTGALNVDGCRVVDEVLAAQVRGVTRMGTFQDAEGNETPERTCRWPANVIHDGSEEVVGMFPVTAASKSGGKAGWQDQYVGGTYKPIERTGYDEAPGSAARFFYCAKASKADRDEGCEANHHPTVKPTALMRYLCRLITPPDGLVFDPFTGSGSTGKAAMLEGFRFLGAELSPEYIEIARARIGHAAGKTRQKELALA